jgi:hypothetical protein
MRGVTRGPVLLIVDSADTRKDLETMLGEAVRDSGPLRVLLLARSTG